MLGIINRPTLLFKRAGHHKPILRKASAIWYQVSASILRVFFTLILLLGLCPKARKPSTGLSRIVTDRTLRLQYAPLGSLDPA